MEHPPCAFFLVARQARLQKPKCDAPETGTFVTELACSSWGAKR